MKIQINRAQVEARIRSAWEKGLYALSVEILADCNEFVKRQPDQKLLESSLNHSRPAQGLLIWETPYARRQYWEIQTALTPGTCWKWCEAARRKHGETWRRDAQRGFLNNL